MPGPTFDQCFVANDQDTLIEQSFTLINSHVYFFLKLHNFNVVKTTSVKFSHDRYILYDL